MRDPRLTKWADVLVHHSLSATKGQTLFLLADPEALPLVTAVYERSILDGVKVEVVVQHRPLTEFLLQHGSDEQITYTPQSRLAAVQQHDLYLYIGSNSNSKMLSNIPSKKQMLAAMGNKPIIDTLLQRTADQKMRWCLTMFPNSSAAQDADMGTEEYEEFVFRACMLDEPSPIEAWRAVEKRQQNLVSFLEGVRELRFRNWHGTDLQVNVEGMKWVNCCGRINFPDGEVYTGPNLHAVHGGVNGSVRFSLPTIYRNVEVCDIELTFEHGAVVKAHASKNEPFLHEMIAIDGGSKYVGEIAFGTNNRIQKCTKSILFDEKIGSTFHLALGKGYPETGNCNQSALHWDMIFDLRGESSVEADGETIMRNGRFVQKEWC
jgi:aminopeptidase